MFCNGITVNCNQTAGKDTIEFRKYLEDAIYTLYPETSDIPGKRVPLILDSGPGQKDLKILASLRAWGFYVIAGMPNSTYATQPTDQNYDHFKSMYHKYLESLVKLCSSHKDKVRQLDIPLLGFGKTTKTIYEAVVLEHTFELAFGIERSKHVWRKIGISPFMRNCLLDNNVAHELIVLPDGSINMEADPLILALVDYEKQNSKAIKLLKKGGFNGDMFRKYAPRKKAPQEVSLPNTRA